MMRSTRRLRAWLAPLLVLAILAAACGDDDEGSATAATPTPAPVVTDTDDGPDTTTPEDTTPEGTTPEGTQEADPAEGEEAEGQPAPEVDAEGACFGVVSEHEPIEADSVAAADLDGETVTLVTYDSFVLSEGILEAFEAETGMTVQVIQAGDTGAMLSQAILTKDNPIGDVMWGVDNSFLCRALNEDIFVPYAADASLLDGLLVDPANRVTPVDYGDVCVNYLAADFNTAPVTFDDLLNEEYRGQIVVQNPESSSPGLAFLLATIATYGEDGWEDYWRALRDNDVAVTSGWSEAYFESFSQYGGDKGVVVSYASSPVAEVVFADPVPETSPTEVMVDTCFRQYEYAGVLAGTSKPEAAARLVDFLVSDEVQNDIPFNLFVFPTTTTATLPPEFVDHAVFPEASLALDPDLIAEKRDEWTARWVEIVLR